MIVGWVSAALAGTATIAASDPLPQPGDPVALVYEEAGEACELSVATAASVTDNTVDIEVGAVLQALLAAAQETGKVRADLAAKLAPCAGLPRVHRVDVPMAGLALALGRPARELEQNGAVQAHLWAPDWVGVLPAPGCPSPCVGELAIHHQGGAPTLFALTVDPAERAATAKVEAAPGSALTLKVGAGATWWFPHGGVTGVHLGEHLALLVPPDAATPVTGFVRVAGKVPQLVEIVPSGGWGAVARDPVLTVKEGRTRKFKLDDAPTRLWVANPQVIAVDSDGGRLTIQGVATGRTHVLLEVDEQPRLVQVNVL